ncbi:ankyrin, partial [Mollisia scopiformis]
DSEAETIVLPGKGGHSPSKIRKSIKHEDRSEDDEMKDAPDSRDADVDNGVDANHEDVPNPSESTTAASMLGKRKRSKHGVANDDNSHLGNSSGLSSVPTSPVATTRSSLSKPAASDSEISKSPSPRSRSRSAVRDKAKSVDRAFPPTPRKRTRSTSPHGRAHKRSISSQLPAKSAHGLSHKKKRVPAPLLSTEYHSDESSASGNSHPRSSRLRSLAAPITGESTISPAKMAPHKKHVNSSGQTQLAIACNRGKLEAVKQRYEDRPGDLNIPDHALNTPLHIASLAGCADIVKFLIDTGHCELNPINLDRDAPLHDAVDNKHVEVVKLLLDAGANPSIPNKNQNEPLELLDLMLDENDGEDGDEDENEREAAKLEIAEMRKAILAAKRKFMDARRGSEDHQMHDHGEGRESHPKESPRQTPPAHESLASGPTNRRTARSLMKTKDRTLWMGYTIEELRAAATEGDVEFINQFLQVKSDVNDPRTLYNAARGGHDAIINLLFALGKFNPDPAPLDGLPHEQATPILATIGKDDHLEVLKLFIGNSDFDPTRRIKGETYFEMAKRRAGPNWQEEEQVLKSAFEAYQKTHKPSSSKPRSPGMRRDGREADRDTKKSIRSDDAQGLRTHKRSTSSPKTKDSELTKNLHRSNSSVGQSKDGHGTGKRGPG